MEGVFSFFPGIFVSRIVHYGEKRLNPLMHWLSAFLVFLGSWMSGFFIIATDAWMHRRQLPHATEHHEGIQRPAVGRNFSIARDRRAARHVDRQRAQTRPRCVPEPCLYLAGMLTSVVLPVYPYVQPSNAAPETSLIIHNAAAAEYGLWIGLSWWIPGMALAGF